MVDSSNVSAHVLGETRSGSASWYCLASAGHSLASRAWSATDRLARSRASSGSRLYQDALVPSADETSAESNCASSHHLRSRCGDVRLGVLAWRARAPAAPAGRALSAIVLAKPTLLRRRLRRPCPDAAACLRRGGGNSSSSGLALRVGVLLAHLVELGQPVQHVAVHPLRALEDVLDRHQAHLGRARTAWQSRCRTWVSRLSWTSRPPWSYGECSSAATIRLRRWKYACQSIVSSFSCHGTCQTADAGQAHGRVAGRAGAQAELGVVPLDEHRQRQADLADHLGRDRGTSTSRCSRRRCGGAATWCVRSGLRAKLWACSVPGAGPQNQRQRATRSP